jgi:DNA replication protein DnaC
VLCQDEIARREAMSMTRRLRRARFDAQATLEGFDFTASPKLPTAQIRDLAALRWLHSGESILLHGPVGVGKTHVAQALGHLAIRQGAEVRFYKTSRALAHLAGGHADRTWPRRLAELVSPAVLILDDFAMRELTAQHADDLYELISERAQAGRSLITTSNRNPPDWYPLFPNASRAEKLRRDYLHLHLTSTSLADQQHTVAKALELGASHLDVGQRPEEGHVVLAGPEGATRST